MKYNKYLSYDNNQVIVLISETEPNKFIPTDPANTDYQAYLAWVTEGNEAQPWE